MERSDGQRERHGIEPHGTDPKHRGRHDGGRQGRSVQKDHRGSEGRDPRAEEHDQHHGRSAERVRVRGYACGERSGNRRKTRRTGGSAGRRGNVEGFDRQRELHGVQPHRSGAEHRLCHHRSREGRSVEKDHDGGEGRDSRAEGDHQHHGRSAQRIRGRSDSRGARGWHRRKTWRPGERSRSRGNLEGPHRQREHAGRQSYRPGTKYRRGDYGDRARRSLTEDHRRSKG